jgi:hypothetical protein
MGVTLFFGSEHVCWSLCFPFSTGNGLFPLIPAFSLGEKGNSFAFFGVPNVSGRDPTTAFSSAILLDFEPPHIGCYIEKAVP